MNQMITALLFVLICLFPLAGKAQADNEAVSQASFTPRLEHEVHFGSLLGQSGAQPGRGVSMEYTGTYRINPYLGVGIGLGAHTFHHDRASSYFPVSAVAKGYLSDQRKITPFGQVALGYGMALDQREGDAFFVDNKGGLSARGALGIEIDVGKELGLIFSVGYQYQRAESIYDINQWWGGPFEEIRKLKYRRIHLQLGIKF